MISKRPRRINGCTGWSALFTVLWYICRKHVSFVEFVAVMTINASYLLNALACLNWAPRIKKTLRAIIGSFRVRYFSPNAQEKNHQSISWLKPFLLIRPPCYCDLLVNVSRFQWPLSGLGNWVSLYPPLKYDRQLSLALLLLKKNWCESRQSATLSTAFFRFTEICL